MKAVFSHTGSVALCAFVSLLLASCAQQPIDRDKHFNIDPLVTASGQDQSDGDDKAGAGGDEPEDPARLQADRGPRAPSTTLADSGANSDERIEQLDGEPIQLELNNLPLPVFINEVFGEKLGLSYSLASALNEREDLVTLRLSEPMEPAALFRTARNVLADYGVAVTNQDGIWTFSLSDDVTTEGTPLLVTGETLPDVPVSHRPVFYAKELSVVKNTQARSMLNGLYRGQKLDISEDSLRNAVILKGPADVVRDAARSLDYFDRPMLKGRNSVVLRPAYREVSALGDALSELLSAQGYAVGDAQGTPGSVILLPMPDLEVIVALANDQATLDHIQRWARKLDRDYQAEIDSGMFIYEVQNTSAANLANLITQLYVGEGTGKSQRDSEGTANANNDNSGDSGGGSRVGSSGGSNSGQARATSTKVAGGRLVVDEQRNVLIFRGAGKDWMELQGIIKQLDKQVPSVLLEVLVAEVTLGDNQGVGVAWQEIMGSVAEGAEAATDTFGTLSGLDVGNSGFSYQLNNAGETKAVLNAFYDSNQAVIRSSPKIMVKSGESAHIEVGNEIPLRTSSRQSDTQTDGSTDLLTQFQYRSTGVNLNVEPIVQSSGLVDIKISQSLSETQDTGSGGNFLPTILNRAVETSLTLRDGGSVVLGGLITKSASEGEQGVPLFGKLPIVGGLFRTQSDNSSTTELMIMVVPYVIRNDDEAQRVSEQLRERIRDSEQSFNERRKSAE